MNINDVKKRFHKKARKLLKVAKIKWYATRLNFYLGRRRRLVAVANHFLKRKYIYLTLLYSVSTAAITWLSGHYLLPIADATTFFTAGGAMIGAALAIILTFNTLIINFAGSEYPPEFYRATGYDWRQNVIYFFLAADAVCLFIFSLIVHTSGQHYRLWLFPTAIALICLSFYLLFASYLVTRKRLDPVTGLSIIYHIALKHLSKGGKFGEKLGRKLAANPALTPEQKELARKEAYKLLAPTLKQVSKINGYLHDYHDKLLAKQNYATALQVLDTIHGILVKYIEIRRNNMQAEMTGYFMVFASDSQCFFEENLQRLVDKAKQYIEKHNAAGAIHITDLMSSLAQHASTVKFGITSKNPLVEQIQGYINFITDEAILKDDTEVLFHLADVYSEVGRLAVIHNYSFGKATAYQQLYKIGQQGVVSKQTSVITQVSGAYNAIIIEMHKKGRSRIEFELNQLFEQYQTLVMFYRVAIPDTRSEALISNPSVMAPYKSILSWIIQLAKLPIEIIDRRITNQLIEIADASRSSMRQMSETISMGDHSIAREFGDVIQSTAILMLRLRSEDGWSDSENELENTANWYINQISWLTEKTTQYIGYITRDLVDNAGEIGLVALTTRSEKVATSAVKVISSLATDFITKASTDNGYDSARMMEVACYIGIYAQKNDMNDLFELTKLKVTEFSVKHNEKHFPNGPPAVPGGAEYIGLHPNHLLRELNRLYEETNPELGQMMPLDTLEERFGEHIDRTDVEAFIEEITPPPTSDTTPDTEPAG